MPIWALYKVYGPSEYEGTEGENVEVHIVVLGDIGRSPRMTYHALSIAKNGGKVKLIGYLETELHADLRNNANITIKALPPPPKKPQFLPFILFAPWKVLFQVYHLTQLLAYGLQPAEWLLVQNPPSIPTLAVAVIICYYRNTKLIIDWHNYGWSILASTKGAGHPLVFIAKLYERFFGHLGHLNLTVSDAMARQLERAPYSIDRPIVAVHDRPAAIFQPVMSKQEREAVLSRVLPRAEKDLVPSIMDGSMRLVVSSTSWTPDEDFSILLDALTQYAAAAGPPVLVVITGKGPQKAMYIQRISALSDAGRLPNVRIVTAFFEDLQDYAKLLACADLGVCLHTSSSGVDLPMKVVDMFGAGLPVAAYSAYTSFAELVKEGENGRGFETAAELANLLTQLLSPEGRTALYSLRKGAIKEGGKRWDEEWESTVGLIMNLVAIP
ncbi:glycosyl transferases group 1-domain-containing protein [Podospora didyma]|uniref:Chitobiosyldiphosphodolichol beta-mannosyltransferase n=1 Tax=Podospora didyma TaxID=330526 RepID=A0AAE0NYE3_9PEZI|nr:glycosyl transferases group 1-domain-containing protein [Podospora didyma]